MNPDAPETLRGSVERVTFFNEDTGFAVLRVAVRGHPEPVTVIGNLPSAHAGEAVTAEGRWTRDARHGLQFKADTLRAAAPDSREGIERYLGGGLIRGIGPVLAKKLVEKFGERVFDIIDGHSSRLEEVDKVGPERRRRIKAAWTEGKAVREIMVFLHAHGAGSSRAVRIYKTYGERAVETVRADPYRLARDVPGIGFKTADGIAQRLGFAPDSPLRAAAGLRYALHRATDEGHCALPEERLTAWTAELLSIDETLVRTALASALEKKDVLRDGELIYLPRMLAAETAVAERILHLAAQPSAFPAVDAGAAADWYEKKTGRALSPSQRRALADAVGSRVFILTGGPGVGKTTLLDAILAVLRAKRVRPVLAAPTGRAAQRLGEATGLRAKTLHRLLEYGPGGFARDESRPLEGDLLVVDECSMLDLPLTHALLRALPREAALLLVGDVDQLPSVGPGLVLRNLLDSGRVPTARLTEIFRQAAASRIVTNAHRVNAGEFPVVEQEQKENQEGVPESDFFFIERPEPAHLADTLVELVAHRIPARWGFDPARDIQVLCPGRRGPTGSRELNARLQARLNPPHAGEETVTRFGWSFRPRDRVIQTANDYDKEVFNGDLGQVERVDPVDGEVLVRFGGEGGSVPRTVAYTFGELDELEPAYAVTVHKSQGSEFPAVVIPLATSHYLLLQRNLLYTGITRGRRLVVLVGQRQALAMAVGRQPDRGRYGALLERLRAG